MTARNFNPPGIVAILLLTSSTALAVPITVDFTGTVTSLQNGVFTDQGDAVRGSFTYDLEMQATSFSDGEFNRFQTGDTANAMFDWEFTVTNGDVTRSTRDFEGDVGSERGFALSIFDAPFSESVEWSGNSSIVRGIRPDDFFLFNMFFDMALLDTDPVRDRDGVAPGSNNLTGDMPDLSSFDPNLFESRAGFVSITGPNPPGPARNLIGQLRFTVDTLTNRISEPDPPVQIPEPSVLVLLLAGATLASFRKRRWAQVGRRARAS